MESQRAPNQLLLTPTSVAEQQTNVSEIPCVCLSLYFGWNAGMCFTSLAQLQKEKPSGPECVPSGLISVWMPVFTPLHPKNTAYTFDEFLWIFSLLAINCKSLKY